MIKIEYSKDLIFLKKRNVHPLIVTYISDYFHLLIKANHCENISKIGAIYFLENVEDSKNHNEMGLSQPIEKSLPEFSEMLTIKNSTDKIKLLYSCFVVSNSYAISVFSEIGTLEKLTEKHLFQDCTELIIKIS